MRFIIVVNVINTILLIQECVGGKDDDNKRNQSLTRRRRNEGSSPPPVGPSPSQQPAVARVATEPRIESAAISPRMRTRDESTKKMRSPRVTPIFTAFTQRAAASGNPSSPPPMSGGSFSGDRSPDSSESEESPRARRRRTGFHSEQERAEAEHDAREAAIENEKFVLEYMKRLNEEDEIQPSPKRAERPIVRHNTEQRALKSALKTDARRRKTGKVEMVKDVRHYKLDDEGHPTRGKDGKLTYEVVRWYIETKPSIKSYVGVHYIRDNIMVATECFIETLFTAYKRGIIGECFKTLKMLGEKIPAKKRYFLVFSTEENKLKNVQNDDISVKLSLRMNELVIRQSYVARIYTKNDTMACFLRPEESEDGFVYHQDTFMNLLRDCLRSLRIRPDPAVLAEFSEHRVLRIGSNGEMTELKRADMSAIISALLDSALVIAKEWRITVELADKVEFICRLPWNIPLRRDAIFEACSRDSQFVPGTPSKGFELMIDDFVVAKYPYQIADSLANGALVLRKINHGVVIKVNLVWRGKEQKTVYHTIIKDFTTPLTIFREHVPDTWLLEKGYRPYVAIRDLKSKRLTDIDEITVTSLLYPVCSNRDDITLEIEQKIRVPLRVEVMMGEKLLILREPNFTNFTYRRNFDTLLKEVKLYVPELVVTQPVARIYVTIIGKPQVEIKHFDDRLIQYCEDKMVCELILVKTTAPPGSKVAKNSKPLPENKDGTPKPGATPKPFASPRPFSPKMVQ